MEAYGRAAPDELEFRNRRRCVSGKGKRERGRSRWRHAAPSQSVQGLSGYRGRRFIWQRRRADRHCVSIGLMAVGGLVAVPLRPMMAARKDMDIIRKQQADAVSCVRECFQVRGFTAEKGQDRRGPILPRSRTWLAGWLVGCGARCEHWITGRYVKGQRLVCQLQNTLRITEASTNIYHQTT